MVYMPKGRRYTRKESFDVYYNPMKYRKFYKDKADIPGFPPGERKHDDERYIPRPTESEKPTVGPLDEFITPDVFDYENCAKCHAAPRNDAWNIYCKECGGRGLLSR